MKFPSPERQQNAGGQPAWRTWEKPGKFSEPGKVRGFIGKAGIFVGHSISAAKDMLCLMKMSIYVENNICSSDLMTGSIFKPYYNQQGRS